MLIRCGRGSWVTFWSVILVIVQWCIKTREFSEPETEQKRKKETRKERRNNGENEDIDEDADHNWR